jgi:hypothetical protein
MVPIVNEIKLTFSKYPNVDDFKFQLTFYDLLVKCQINDPSLCLQGQNSQLE